MDLKTMIISAGPSGHHFGGTAKGRAYCKQNNFKMLLDFWVSVAGGREQDTNNRLSEQKLHLPLYALG